MKQALCLFHWLCLLLLLAFQNNGPVVVAALTSDSSSSLQPTLDPPLLNVPTYSLATCDGQKTGMNILTYAAPVSIRPDRIWSLGLYKGTWTHEQFQKTGTGILQLLAVPHAAVVRLLGGTSMRDVDKQAECAELGFPWISVDDNEAAPIKVLPGCVHYLKVRLVGDLVDCGSHDLAICKVESMFVSSDNDDKEALMTSKLRELGIITAQGRVAED